MNLQVLIKNTVANGALLLFSTTCGLAGVHDIVAPPPASGDCDGCTNPGPYVQGTLLHMKSYSSKSSYEGDWDAGFRGAVGTESASGLRFQLSGFHWQGDYRAPNNFINDASKEFFYLDATIGDTIHCGELCVSVSAGLRWGGKNEQRSQGSPTLFITPSPKGIGGNNRQGSESEFSGIGPVISIEATRRMSDRLSLYASLRQSFLFGEEESVALGIAAEQDTFVSITEIGAGVQLAIPFLGLDSFVRAGIEGQWWAGDGDSDDGLIGGSLGAGASF